MTTRRSFRASEQRSRSALRHAALAAVALAALVTSAARAQSPILVSLDATGGPADSDSYGVRVSATGRYVAFTSNAEDLVDQPSATGSDVFVRDLVTGVTELISTDPGGGPANGISTARSLSADGRWVVFASHATNLVPGGAHGLYVRDRVTGLTTEETLAPGGGGVGNGFEFGSISDDGRWLVFGSFATALVADDTNAAHDVFVRDRQAGTTTRVSVGPGGAQGNGSSLMTSPASISADGRWIVFTSFATNLVPDVLQDTPNVYLQDLSTGVTSLLNVNALGQPGDASAEQPTISADGLVAAFVTAATNLGSSGPAVDVFVRDLQTGAVEAVSKTSLGAFGIFASEHPSLSEDGRWVAFHTRSPLVQLEGAAWQDVYLHDRLTTLTLPASQDTAGVVAHEHSFVGQVSRDGHAVGFFCFDSLAPPAPGFRYDAYEYDRLQAAPWTDLGAGLAGSFGVPVLLAEGPLTGGSGAVFALASAPGGAPTMFVAGFSALNLPFKGGTLVPSPDVIATLALPPAGKLKLAVHWPASAPAGTQLWLQAWFADAAAPQGLSASNALLATTP